MFSMQTVICKAIRRCDLPVKQKIMHFAQKVFIIFVKFVNTFKRRGDIIINVKTPQYIIYFLLHPIISEIPSPKRTAAKLSFLPFIEAVLQISVY